METVNIIFAILIYFVLPVVVILGVIVIFRRKRLREMGKSAEHRPLNKEDISDIQADESKEARHIKPSPKNIDPDTGSQPDDEDIDSKPTT